MIRSSASIRSEGVYCRLWSVTELFTVMTLPLLTLTSPTRTAPRSRNRVALYAVN